MEKKRRKVRKKRRKQMTSEEMRQQVAFQSGLSWKGKLAFAGVTVVCLALTVVVMLIVNGSLSLGRDEGDDNPFNSGFKEPGESLDPFAPDDNTVDNHGINLVPSNAKNEGLNLPEPRKGPEGKPPPEKDIFETTFEE